MADPITQVFPRREAGGMVLHRFPVDWRSALSLAPAALAGDRGERLQREAAEMAEHLPRWLLTVGRLGRRVACPSCGGPLVFERGIRCAGCRQTQPRSALGRGARLSWFGLLPPVGIDSLARLRAGLERRPPPGHALGRGAGIGGYLLVPLVAAYPDEFPARPPEVHYDPGFFDIKGAPPNACSHEVHLYGNGQMCLFACGEWRAEMSLREVLQQRAYAHVIKMLNWIDGKKRAFAIVS